MKAHTAAGVFLLCVAFVSLSSAAYGGGRGQLVGGWKPIENLNDSHVKEIAEFAVGEHNKKANPKLTLVSVAKGETQVVAGTNYRLILVVKEAAAATTEKFQAVVYERPWENYRKLNSFKPVA